MSEQTELFGGVSTEESSEVARATAPQSAAPEAGIVLCAWCNLSPSTTIMYGWTTCALCAMSRESRVNAYQQRLKRAAKER